jgi:transcription elongation factor Elf1
MSIYLDRKYLLQISPKLGRFAKKKDDLFNFRCPLCGDSQKNKTKSRGYVYRKKDSYFYMCHNCHASMNFYNFLEKVDSNLIKEYALERYKSGDNSKKTVSNTELGIVTTKTPIFKKNLTLPTIKSLPDEHYAKVYTRGRQIPETYWSTLYFAEDFKNFVEVQMKIEKDGLIDDDPRLVIPFYDADKNLVAFQGRSLRNSKLRYITVKVTDDSSKLFGLDRANTADTIYVTEGPIDSMFLENAVATADSNLSAASKYISKDKLVLVFDNEPRNKDICKIMEKAIDEHYRVVIWPEMIDKKDINDMILDGFLPEDIQDIISKNTYVNLRAKAEFVNWKKL